MSRRKSVPELVHDAIERGATSVEEIHKSIAALPLKVLEELGVLPHAAREIEKVQDHSIAAVYDALRKINDEILRSTYRSSPQP